MQDREFHIDQVTKPLRKGLEQSILLTLVGPEDVGQGYRKQIFQASPGPEAHSELGGSIEGPV